MKRCFVPLGAVFCAVLLCTALLTACARQEGSASAAAEPSPGAENGFAAQRALPFPVGTLYALSWCSSSSGFYGCSSGTAYYELVQANVAVDAAGVRWEDWLILRTDYETRVQAPLCSVPGCAHTDDACPALLRSKSELENFYIGIVNGQLYILHTSWWGLVERSGADSEPTVWLEAAAMDGSGRTRLTELPPKWQLSGPFLLTDGTALYGQYDDHTDNSRHGVRVELESGAYTSFSFGLDDGEVLVGALDSRFVLLRSNSTVAELAYPEVMPSTEQMHLAAQTAFSSLSSELVLLDPAAGTRTGLNEILPPPVQRGEAMYTTFFQQGKYYCLIDDIDEIAGLSQTLWQIDLAKGECRTLAQRGLMQSDGWWSIEGLTLFPSGSGREEPYISGSFGAEDNLQHGFLIDVHDGAIYPTALRYRQAYSGTGPVVPLAQTNDGLWLVQTEEVPTLWGHYRFFHALAAPETVFSGEGELYPIRMWTPEAPLG